MNLMVIGGIALAVSMGLVGVQTWRLDRVKADLVEQQIATKTAEAKTRASEEARAAEAAAATASFEGLSSACEAGLKIAVQRGRTVERIISAPPRPDGSRGLVGARELRDVVGEPAS